MRGIGTDGASTMIGCHNGAVKILKSIAPSLIGVHRAAHPLNLASKQEIKFRMSQNSVYP